MAADKLSIELIWAISRIGCVAVLGLFACSPDPQTPPSDIDLTVLTLNLHTYQELQTEGIAEADLTSDEAQRRIERYDPIFNRIADGITDLDPDIICFQEVGEWSGGVESNPGPTEFGATDTNMVRQILLRLKNTSYYDTMDWSHHGWQAWLEGSAILSKYPIAISGSRFVSKHETGNYESWKSRNVPMAILEVPAVGDVSVFSVHTGWWDDPEEPFQEQYQRLLDWAEEVSRSASASILCGDFNVPAGGPAYRFMTTGTGYSDQYLRANPDGMFDATIGGNAHGWENSDSGQRIDYILMNEASPLQVVRARRVFSEADFGRVSDHLGIYAEFRITTGR